MQQQKVRKQVYLIIGMNVNNIQKDILVRIIENFLLKKNVKHFQIIGPTFMKKIKNIMLFILKKKFFQINNNSLNK